MITLGEFIKKLLSIEPSHTPEKLQELLSRKVGVSRILQPLNYTGSYRIINMYKEDNNMLWIDIEPYEDYNV
jgi:hypothetical protein